MARGIHLRSLLTLIVLITIIYVAHLSTSGLQSAAPSLMISTNEARARRFGLILDMRSQAEREQLGYYPNSIPVSLNTLQTEVPFLNSNKKTFILVYSSGDDKAYRAAAMLHDMGYINARYIAEPYLSLMPRGAQAL